MADLGFFVVLLPAFLRKMNIPTAAVKHISKEKRCIKTAELVSPSEESWHLHVHRKNKGAVMYFGGRTWHDFVTIHNLKPGYFLVFNYKGDMIFHFRAYDLTTCEITSYFKSNINVQDQKISFENHLIKHNGVKVETDQKLTEVKEEIESQDEIGYVKKRKLSNPTFQRKKKVLKYNVKDDTVRNGEYEAIICSSNLKQAYMKLPYQFSDIYGLSELNEIALMDPEKRMWQCVHLFHRRARWGNPRNVSKIGTPWSEFARANNLKIGDACVFKIHSNKRTGEAEYMEVEIRRMNGS